jgi:broad specificity phosphatase PhoE
MSRVFFIRHAAVVLDPRPAPEWRLSAEGVDAARRLARELRLVGVGRIVSSPEPKALDTAAPLAEARGLELAVEDDLREVARDELPVLARRDYVALVGRYLGGESLDGWEPADEARARFAAAVYRHRAEHAGDTAIVTHGLVLALYLGLTPARWEAMRLPDVLEAED